MPLSGLRAICDGIAVPLFLGLMSSFVCLSRFGMRSWRQLVSSVVASCFVAVLVHWGLDYASFVPTVDAAIIGTSAYMGGSLLDAVHMRVLREVKNGKKNGQNSEQNGGSNGEDNSD